MTGENDMTSAVDVNSVGATTRDQVPEFTIRVVHLYDQYLNIYADRGNIAVLQQRCAWRGIGCNVAPFGLDGQLGVGEYDVIYVGGGQDRDQRLIADKLVTQGPAIKESVDAGAVVLAVCGGYQLLGRHYIEGDGSSQPGTGLFDAETVAGSTRIIGNIAIDVELPPVNGDGPSLEYRVVGFENHAGRTELGASATPLGTVVAGGGNDGSGMHEGCRYKHAIGTYLHGPLLPRNVELADWLIAAALHHRYGGNAPALQPLNDTFAHSAQEVSLQRALAERR